jgi:hypothetical protein
MYEYIACIALLSKVERLLQQGDFGAETKTERRLPTANDKGLGGC